MKIYKLLLPLFAMCSVTHATQQKSIDTNYQKQPIHSGYSSQIDQMNQKLQESEERERENEAIREKRKALYYKMLSGGCITLASYVAFKVTASSRDSQSVIDKRNAILKDARPANSYTQWVMTNLNDYFTEMVVKNSALSGGIACFSAGTGGYGIWKFASALIELVSLEKPKN